MRPNSPCEALCVQSKYDIFCNNVKTHNFYVVRQPAYVHEAMPRCKDFH